jgi:hypothetical protein
VFPAAVEAKAFSLENLLDKGEYLGDYVSYTAAIRKPPVVAQERRGEAGGDCIKGPSRRRNTIRERSMNGKSAN